MAPKPPQKHPSFTEDSEGSHYVPGKARGQSPFDKPHLDMYAVNPSLWKLPDGRIDWIGYDNYRRSLGMYDDA